MDIVYIPLQGIYEKNIICMIVLGLPYSLHEAMEPLFDAHEEVMRNIYS